MGVPLFDSDWDVAASRQRSATSYASDRDELFRRRLSEARAFGAASEELSIRHPAFSARWGMTAQQRVAGFLAFVGYFAWMFLAPGQAINALAIVLAIAFGLIIALRLCMAIAALLRKPAPTSRRLQNDELPAITILVPLYR